MIKLILETLIDITYSTCVFLLGALVIIFAYQTSPTTIEQFNHFDPQITKMAACLLFAIMAALGIVDFFIEKKPPDNSARATIIGDDHEPNRR